MHLLTLLAVVLTLLLGGIYAGLIVMTQIGILPALRLLRPPAFAEAWGAMDHFMGRSMPPYKAAMLLVTLLATLGAAQQRQQLLSAALGASFVCSLAGLILTVRKQVPLSTRLRQLPADAPEALLVEMREQTARNIRERLYLALLAFVLPCTAAVLTPLP